MCAAAGKWCLDCRWLEIRLRLQGSSYYWCRSRDLALKGSILNRRGCKKYEADPRRGPPVAN